MKNKKGFTLVEILGVVIVLAVILTLAVPGVIKYLNDSKRKTYVQTATAYIRAVKAKVSNFKYHFDSEDEVFYIPVSCINVDKAGESPYGDITEAYVAVTYKDGNFEYYWTSYDNSGHGIKLTAEKDLSDATIDTSMYSIDKNTVVGSITKYVDMDNNTCNKRPVISEVSKGYQIYPNKESYTTSGLTEISEGVTTTTNNDPYIDFSGLKEYQSVSGVVIYFKEAVINNMSINIYTRDTDTYDMTKGIRGSILAGKKEVRIEVPEGTYNGIRVDIGDVSGLSYKIDRIELIVEDDVGLYTNKDITAYVRGINEEEGVYEYSYDNGNTWVTNATTRYSSNTKVQILIKDIIGSKSEVNTLSINTIDKINPTCNLMGSGTKEATGWYRSNVTISFANKKDSSNADYSASGIRRVGTVSYTL